MNSSSKERQLALKLLNKYGGEVDDYFKLWPKDKEFYFSSDGQAFLAYRVKYKEAICLFDPVGKPTSAEELIKEFRHYCDARHLSIIFIQTTNKLDKAYRKENFKRIMIGADALINIDKFLDTTLKNKYFRNIANRFKKNQFSVDTHKPPHSVQLMKALKEVSDDWLQLPHHKEWKFLTGRFSTDYLKDLNIYALKEKDKIIAFANGLPTYTKKAATIDLIRRRRDAPPNAIDFLFIEIMKSLKKDKQIEYFNIGISPIDASKFANTTTEKILIALYKSSSSFIGFKGLHQFKAKYKPEWQPRYVYFRGSIFSLGLKGLAIFKLML